MREGWVNQKILDFCYVTDFVANGSFASLRQNVRYINSPDYAILVRLTDFTKKWVKEFVYVSKESFEFLNKSSLVEGDLIMSNVGEPGIVFLVPELNRPMTLGPNSILIRPSTEYASSKFLYFYFLSIKGKEQIDEISTGAAQKKFNKTSFRSLEIPIPPLPEQQRIVAILDEAFAAIDKAKANAEKNLKNAKELFESYLQGVFENKGDGWEEKSLGEIATFSQGIQVGIEHHLMEPKLGYVRFIRIVDYTQNTNDIRYIPDPGDKYFVNEDDIVMVRYGTPGLIGRGKAGVIANNLFKINVKPKNVSNDFLCIFLSQKHIQTYLSTQGSSTMPALNFGQLKVVPVYYPSIEEQKKIVLKLSSISLETKRLESIYQQKLTDLEELKKSILQKAFNGELNTADICV